MAAPHGSTTWQHQQLRAPHGSTTWQHQQVSTENNASPVRCIRRARILAYEGLRAAYPDGVAVCFQGTLTV
eukprot:187986-Prorocentrum_minimum.AAC.1